MLEDTLRKIEAAIRRIDSVKGADQAELLRLLAALKTEISRLSQTHGEQAHSIASLADIAAHEATRKEKSPALLNHSLDGLSLSAEDFEASHPKLVEIVNQICTMLANLGI